TPAPVSNAPVAFQVPQFSTNDDEADAVNGRPGQPARPPIFSTFPAPQGGTNNNGTGTRPVLPVVRPGVVVQPPQNPQGAPERIFNEVNQPPAGAAPQSSAPSASPGGLVGTSAPGMMPPAAAGQPGQIVTQPTRPNND